MKNLLICIAFLLFATSIYAQENKSINCIRNQDGFFCTIININNSIDTLACYSYKIELLDYRIIGDTVVSYIIEDPLSYMYNQFIKKNNKWIVSMFSGSIVGNPKNSGYIPKGKFFIPKDFKIINDNLVSYTYDGKTIIKDCNDFRIEYERKMDRYNKYLESKKQNQKNEKN